MDLVYYCNEANELRRKGKISEAHLLIKQGLIHYPKSFRLYNLSAFTYEKEKNYEKAIKKFSMSLKLNEYGCSAYYGRKRCVNKLKLLIFNH